MQWNIDSLAIPYSSVICPNLKLEEAGPSLAFCCEQNSCNRDVIDRLKMFSFALSEVLMIAIHHDNVRMTDQVINKKDLFYY